MQYRRKASTFLPGLWWFDNSLPTTSSRVYTLVRTSIFLLSPLHIISIFMCLLIISSTSVDPTQTNPALPSGHPFDCVAWSFYWSATASASDTSRAWGVNMGNSLRDIHDKANTSYYFWCIRGGQGTDLQ